MYDLDFQLDRQWLDSCEYVLSPVEDNYTHQSVSTYIFPWKDVRHIHVSSGDIGKSVETLVRQPTGERNPKVSSLWKEDKLYMLQ